MNNMLINDDFGKSIKKLRGILPVLSFTLLIATYVISAIIMGIFHAQKAPNIGFTIAAFLIPFAIQAGRGTLVFFFQLNPTRIQGKLSFGLIAATAMLILSLIEAYLVMNPYGLSWIISVAMLMVIGWIIEIMILKETIFATQVELFQDKDKWNEVKGFYIAQVELTKFLKDIKKGEVPTPPEAFNKPEIVEKEDGDSLPQDKAVKLLKEINSHLEGKDKNSSLNGQEKGGE